jgi:hypothetical protein
MPYLLYEQEAISTVVKTVSDLAPPANATHCELQADTQNIRYTMDGTAPTVTAGMVLLTTSEPKSFLIADLKAIKFIRSGGADAVLNVHYFAGRDI